MATNSTDIFQGLKVQRDLTKYSLMRGVTDYANLQQFNMFETGYSFLVVTGVPKFLEVLASQNTNYQNLLNTYLHILEYEFKGMDGLNAMEVDTGEINNGITTLNIIDKVNWQSASQFSMRFTEKSGSTMTKLHELYLRGIKDPRTQVKHYNGLIKAGLLQAGYENEVFSFMYIVTDNTQTNIEKAFYIVAAQPTSADFSIYNSEKGSIEFKEIEVPFNGYPITGPKIYAKAQELLNWITTNYTFDESQFDYTGVNDVKSYINGNNATK